MSNGSKSTGLLLVIAYVGFISLGLPDTVVGVAWPSVRDSFGRQQSDLAWVFFGFGCSYVVSSFFTGKLLRVLRVGSLLAASSALVAMSGFGYGLAPVWVLFAACSILHGLGSGAIDAGLNHYVAHHFSARQMNWLHACYSVGAMLGPLIMTAMIAGAGKWRAGYLTVAGILCCLAVLFAATRGRWSDHEPGEGREGEPGATISETLRRPLVWLQIALFFVYTGLEVTVGQWSFTVLTETRGVRTEAAGLWVTIYWASIGVGRVVFGFLVDRIGIDRLLRWSMLGAAAGVLLFMLDFADWTSAVALSLTGLGLAAIFPCLMTRTPQRLGKAIAAQAIGFQVSAAMFGAAVLPSLAGFLAERWDNEAIPQAALGMAVLMWALHEVLLAGARKKQALTDDAAAPKE